MEVFERSTSGSLKRSYPSDCSNLSDLVQSPMLLTTPRGTEQRQLRQLAKVQRSRWNLGVKVAEQFRSQQVDPLFARRYWTFWCEQISSKAYRSPQGKTLTGQPHARDDYDKKPSGSGAFNVTYTKVPSALVDTNDSAGSGSSSATSVQVVSALLRDKDKEIGELKQRVKVLTREAKANEQERISLEYQRNAANEYEEEARGSFSEISIMLDNASSTADLLEVELAEQEHRLYLVQRCWLGYLAFLLPSSPVTGMMSGDFTRDDEEDDDELRSGEGDEQEVQEGTECGDDSEPFDHPSDGDGHKRPMPPAEEWNAQDLWFREEQIEGYDSEALWAPLELEVDLALSHPVQLKTSPTKTRGQAENSSTSVEEATELLCATVQCFPGSDPQWVSELDAELQMDVEDDGGKSSSLQPSSRDQHQLRIRQFQQYVYSLSCPTRGMPLEGPGPSRVIETQGKHRKEKKIRIRVNFGGTLRRGLQDFLNTSSEEDDDAQVVDQMMLKKVRIVSCQF